jgi:two-component system nitrate/nitrite response regulator NarL
MLRIQDEEANDGHPSAMGLAHNTTGNVATVLLCLNSLLRAGLSHVLSGTCFTVVEASGAPPALHLLHVSEPSERVLEDVRNIKCQHPETRIALIGDHFASNFMLQAIAAGVDGFCLATSEREVLVKSLELIMLGEKILPGPLIRSLLSQAPAAGDQAHVNPATVHVPDDPRVHKLTPREKVILQSLMGGDANKVIARKLDIAEATIKVHVKAILRKVGAANRTQAAMWATANLTDAGPSAGLRPEGVRLS